MAPNERNTENLVRDRLRKLNYYSEDNNVRVEEQKSNIESIRKLLRSAGKTGKGGPGAPEFIITCDDRPDFVLIVECKARLNDHESAFVDKVLLGATLDENQDAKANRTRRFAVDGALHYAEKLSRDYNVIALGVSGQTEKSLKVSTFLHPKKARYAKRLETKTGNQIATILPWPDYIEHATFDPMVQRLRLDELMAFSRDLHEFMRDHAKLTESEKPLLVSGTLIALRNSAFANSYDRYAPEDLQKEWLHVIKSEIDKAEIPRGKKDSMTQPYSSIAVHPELGKPTKAYPRGVLHELINRLNDKVWPFISIYHNFDIVGQFYGEFLKYTGGDKKSLGIVLTPRHITELAARIAGVNSASSVLDICAGTGGFLISAMNEMMRSAMTETERDRIRRHGLVGVEQQPNMFALAASNMILRGDGKANLHQGSCFDSAIVKDVRNYRCDVGLINPPFSQNDVDLHELRFVIQMLECLEKGGIGVAITPMSCAISPHPNRAELLRDHTLEAVMSLPDELFYPVGTITCMMVFRAKIPHALSDKSTWFGYWKSDGFIKSKNRGRIDPDDQWKIRCERWVEMFKDRQIHPGESVQFKVSADDEWCAEAYMETDYSKLTDAEFERVVRNYAIFKLLGSRNDGDFEGTTEEYQDT